MKITVKVSGMFKAHFPNLDSHNGFEVEIPEGSKVADLFQFLGIPAASEGVTVIANGRILSIEEKLAPGTIINLLPIMSGG